MRDPQTSHGRRAKKGGDVAWVVVSQRVVETLIRACLGLKGRDSEEG